jgi:lipoate---protein ligase
MRYLELTLPTLAENLALDEALLEQAEGAAHPIETLRLWEARQHAVVVGRSSRVEFEVCLDACRDHRVPVLRRISGGAAVVIGPGCLMYSLVLSLQARPLLRSIDRAHEHVLSTIATALRPKAPGLALRGICDLAIGERKVSGNSVRLRREHMLYHGTLLYDFPMETIAHYLAMPPRMPDYRQTRPHTAFVANLPLGDAELRSALQAAWAACDLHPHWPEAAVQKLVAEKYSRPEWNEQL